MNVSSIQSQPRSLEPAQQELDLPFEVLADRYNFRNIPTRRRLFTNLLIRELEACPSPRTVIDIGCGSGMGRVATHIKRIREHVDEFWGVEPDESVTPADGLFDHFQHALMETAELPENTFDLAYSFMVMEHVSEPAAFLDKVYRCLKPGGRYFFVTPNGNHYFGLITRLCKRIRMDELILRMVRGDDVDLYHYPVQYRCNTQSQIRKHAVAAGFETPEFVMAEDTGPVRYFPGPLRPFFHLMTLKRRYIHNPRCLIDIIARLRRPDAK